MKESYNEEELIAQLFAMTENNKEHDRIQRKMPGVRYIGEMTTPGLVSSLRHFDMNECMVEMLLYSRKEIEALQTNFFRIVIHPDDLHFIGDSVDFMNKNAHGSVFSALLRFMTKKNKIIWVSLNITRASQHSDGSTLQFLCNGSIITQSKHNDLQLKLFQKDNQLRINLRTMPPSTMTEKKVIKLLVNGKNSRQIGKALFISIGTVKTHRRSIYKKFGVHHIADLIAKAIKYGLN